MPNFVARTTFLTDKTFLSTKNSIPSDSSYPPSGNQANVAPINQLSELKAQTYTRARASLKSQRQAARARKSVRHEKARRIDKAPGGKLSPMPSWLFASRATDLLSVSRSSKFMSVGFYFIRGDNSLWLEDEVETRFCLVVDEIFPVGRLDLAPF